MDTIALTYRELADRLGVKPESARKSAQRKHWKRVTGNDGTARVYVPLDALPSSCDNTEDRPRDSHEDTKAVLNERIRGLEALLAEMRVANDDLRVDRDRWFIISVRPWWKRLQHRHTATTTNQS